MSHSVTIEVELPDDLSRFRLPEGIRERLQELLDRQDRGVPLTERERSEAEGLVDLSETLTVLRLRSERKNGTH